MLITHKKFVKKHLPQCAFDYFNQEIDKIKE